MHFACRKNSSRVKIVQNLRIARSHWICSCNSKCNLRERVSGAIPDTPDACSRPHIISELPTQSFLLFR